MPATQFGETFRDARQRRGLTVEQLSSQTTIPVADIEAIEAGVLNALPRAMYRRAEVRAYAEAVGLDPDVALTQLRSAERPDSIVPPAAPAAPVLQTTTERAAAPSAPLVSTPHTAVAAAPVGGGRSPAVGNRQRIGRALFMLLIGCAGLLWDGNRAPALDVATESSLVVPALTPADVIEEAVRIAEVPAPAPNVRRVLYDPRTASRLGTSEGRLDGGVLVVHSTPRGARVTVNGVGWGVTPVAIRYLPMGALKVRVGKDDYAMHERVVELKPGQPSSTLRVTLTPLPRRAQATSAPASGDMLVITTVPAGARVTVNGIGWGTTPLRIRHLAPGVQRVRVVKDQFRSEERVVTVSEGRTGRVALTLKPQS